MTKELGPFLGINNRRPDFDLGIKEGRYLKTAVNVDIDNAGRIRRRTGTAMHQAMTNAHSLQMTSATTGLLVRGSALYAITLPSYSETLLKVLSSDARMSYVKIASDWYYSNGVDAGRISAGSAYPMGLPTPPSPTLSTIGGSILKGWCQVTTTYVNTTTGEESGAAPSGNIELTSMGGIRVTLPGATSGATHVNVYVSASNGTMPVLHSTVAADTATIDLTTAGTGRPANSRFEAPLPAGTLFEHNGRLCSFKDDMLYVGLPFRPGYYQVIGGFIPFPSNVSVAISNQTGVFVAADKTYYIPGDLGNVQEDITTVLPYGAVPGTTFAVPNKPQWGWFGMKGFVLVGAGSEVQTVMSDNVDVTAPDLGVAEVFECDGYRRVTSCGYTMNLANMAVSTYTGFDFTSLSDCYGTKPDGLYLTDTTGVADALVNLGKLNFGTEQFKLMPSVYLGVDSLSSMTARIQTPTEDYTYPVRSYGAGLQVRRIDAGRGLKSNWFEITLANTAGADFTMASASFDPVVTVRRI